MTTVLLTGGRIVTPLHPSADAIVLTDDTVAWVGSAADPRADPSGVDEVIALDGAIVTPAFVDTHVHTTSTGLALTSLDLSECRSLAELLDAVEVFAAGHRGQTILGQGWDETRYPEARPPTSAELDSATGGAAVYLSRVDVHSAACSSALLDAVAGIAALDGANESGHVSLDAHHAARQYAFGSLTDAHRLDVMRAALAEASRQGIGYLHENAGPGISGEGDLVALLQLSADEPGPHVTGYWGALADTESLAIAERLHLPGLAGDLFADGSLGSHTAYLADGYADACGDSRGHSYVSESDVAAHVRECTRRGLQAGFHVIGDEALSIVLAGFQRAAEQVGRAAVRAGRHRLEHLQLAGPEHWAVMADLGLLASVQPVSDHLWGGTEGMYAERLGAARARSTNPYRPMKAAGVPIAFSSDAPVTPLGGWAAVRAAVRHHEPAARLSLTEAFDAHTVQGHHAGNASDTQAGLLVPGAPASLAVWNYDGALDASTALPDVGGSDTDPVCALTIVAGRVSYREC